MVLPDVFFVSKDNSHCEDLSSAVMLSRNVLEYVLCCFDCLENVHQIFDGFASPKCDGIGHGDKWRPQATVTATAKATATEE